MRWDLDFFFSLKNVNYNSKWEIWTLNVLVESWYSTRISWKHQEILVSWGQFLSRPSVALVVIFGLVTKLVVLYHHWLSLIWHKEEGFPSNVGLSKLKMTTSATFGLDQTSGTLSPLVIPYMAWRGRFSFQCGTLQAKNDYKCNIWSRQKLSPH